MLQQRLQEAAIDLVKVTKREHTPGAGLYARLLFFDHSIVEMRIVDTTVDNSFFISTKM